MRTVPKTRSKQISFFQSHIAKWSENRELLGLSDDEIADIEAKLAAANEAFLAHRIAQNKARAATSVFYSATKALTLAGGSAILKVRAAARTQGVTIYQKANLSKPKKASPIAVPGKPTDFEVDLQQIGMVTLKWKCKNPRNAEGTIYEIWREVRRAGETQFAALEFLGVAGKKKFEDWTIPAGVASIIYRVTAVRSTRRGPEADYTLRFGGTGRMPTTMQARRAA